MRSMVLSTQRLCSRCAIGPHRVRAATAGSCQQGGARATAPAPVTTGSDKSGDWQCRHRQEAVPTITPATRATVSTARPARARSSPTGRRTWPPNRASSPSCAAARTWHRCSRRRHAELSGGVGERRAGQGHLRLHQELQERAAADQIAVFRQILASAQKAGKP